jgi:hypothetical protein
MSLYWENLMEWSVVNVIAVTVMVTCIVISLIGAVIEERARRKAEV